MAHADATQSSQLACSRVLSRCKPVRRLVVVIACSGYSEHAMSITWWQAFYYCIARPACSAPPSRRLSPSSGLRTADALRPSRRAPQFRREPRPSPWSASAGIPATASPAIQQPRHQPTSPLQHRQQARDVLRAGRHLAPRRQFGEKRLALYLPHLSWMPLAICQNEAPDPAHIRLLGPQAVMMKSQPTTDLIQQLGVRGVITPASPRV